MTAILDAPSVFTPYTLANGNTVDAAPLTRDTIDRLITELVEAGYVVGASTAGGVWMDVNGARIEEGEGVYADDNGGFGRLPLSVMEGAIPE